jgi:hypothetical protein
MSSHANGALGAPNSGRFSCCEVRGRVQEAATANRPAEPATKDRVHLRKLDHWNAIALAPS